MTNGNHNGKRFKKRQLVYDRWWPHRIGQVIDAAANFVRVRFSGGEVVRYDKPHMRFLEEVKK